MKQFFNKEQNTGDVLEQRAWERSWEFNIVVLTVTRAHPGESPQVCVQKPVPLARSSWDLNLERQGSGKATLQGWSQSGTLGPGGPALWAVRTQASLEQWPALCFRQRQNTPRWSSWWDLRDLMCLGSFLPFSNGGSSMLMDHSFQRKSSPKES